MIMALELNYIETIGAIFGIILVVLTARESLWCWPTGIVSVVLYGFFYYQQTLYASMYLQVFYLISCIVGWYQWLYGGNNKTRLQVSKTKANHLWQLVAITVFMFLVMGLLFDKKSNDDQPYLDSFVTALSFVAQWMMNHKLLESWFLWIIADVVYAIMHLQRENYPSFLMYVILVVSAVVGYFMWKKSIKKTSSPS
jgi:nicotinamide mononucleotide transporter